jgi:hypothetical protein
LVYWFLTHRLIVETGVDAVPVDRRFGFTRFQSTENELQDRIGGEYAVQDVELGEQAIEEVPYDSANRYEVVDEDSDEEVDEDEEDANLSLERAHDDADLCFLNRTEPKYDSDGDVEMTDAVFDDSNLSLSFLDAY